MRKSTVIILVILFAACVGMLFVFDFASQKTKETTQVAQRLTRLFGDRGDLVSGTHLRLRWENEELGRAGQGLKVEITPSQAVLGRRGGLRSFARALSREAPAGFGRTGDALQWMRIRVFLPEGAQLDTWLERDVDGAFADPNPPLPERWPENPAPPGPPPAPTPPPVPGPGPGQPPK